MHRLVILFCALAPSIVLLQYGIAKARARWDDSLIWEAFFSGGVATIFVLVPALLLKSAVAIDAMSSVHAAATNALVIAAIPEEAMKLGALFYMIRRHGDDAGGYDLITLAFAVGLGFAAIENIGYLLAPGDWQLVAANRAMLSVPGHGLNGLAMGACLTAAELHPRHRRLWLIMALVIPILMHASFDFPLLLFAKNPAFVGVLPAWFVMLILTTIAVVWWSNKMRAAAQPTYDPRAGSVNPRLTGVMILLFAPLLALGALFQGGYLGVAGAAALSILLSILSIDLLRTGFRPVRAV